MFTKRFWMDAVGKTNWQVVGIATAVAVGGTLLKCVAASFKGNSSSASMVQ